MSFVPKKVFFVRGKGFHKSKLVAFEQALREAGIEKFNIVNVSSILPPNCIEIDKTDGLKLLKNGQIVFGVISRAESNEFNQLIAASIGVAKPADKRCYGYLSEHHAFGNNPEKVGELVEDLAAEMLATALGVTFDPDLDYDERQEVFKMNGKILETKNITSYAVVKEEGWAVVLAAAIFIL